MYTILTCLREWFGVDIDDELLRRVRDMPQEQCEALAIHLEENLSRLEIPELEPGETRPLIYPQGSYAQARQQLLLAPAFQ